MKKWNEADFYSSLSSTDIPPFSSLSRIFLRGSERYLMMTSKNGDRNQKQAKGKNPELKNSRWKHGGYMAEDVELPKLEAGRFEAEKRHPPCCKMGGERKLEGRSTATTMAINA